MQPTPELVALAKEFHELGGTEGIENPYTLGRWIVHPFFEKDNVAFLIGYIDQGDDEAGDDYWAKSNKAIPILTESELWAWLWKRDYKLTRYKTGLWALDHYSQTSYWQEVKTFDEHIDTYEVHLMLYVAAVLVAKEKK